MAASIHDISLLLGKLSAQTENLQSQLRDLTNTLEQVRNKSSQTLQAIELLQARVALIESALEKTIKPSIYDYKKLKQRGIGILGAVGMLSAGGSLIAQRLIRVLFGE
jgi:chromosome segregation ATPase